MEASHLSQNAIALRPHPRVLCLSLSSAFPLAENTFSSLQVGLSSPFQSFDPFPVTLSEAGLRGGRLKALPAKKGSSDIPDGALDLESKM